MSKYSEYKTPELEIILNMSEKELKNSNLGILNTIKVTAELVSRESFANGVDAMAEEIAKVADEKFTHISRSEIMRISERVKGDAF